MRRFLIKTSLASAHLLNVYKLKIIKTAQGKAATNFLFNKLLQGDFVENNKLKVVIYQVHSYIKALELRSRKIKPTRRYKSITPNQSKVTVVWNQPSERKSPVYIFDIHCPYCDKDIQIKRLSPHYPANCGQADCVKEHKRLLARNGKRRQRKRIRESLM